MLPIITLVLGLMVATAVISYWSDNLGKKLGKKRVSLFGLRPKQTATLITITSSMPIMLFTLAATLYVYQPLREALINYEKVRQDADFAAQKSQLLQKINAGLATKSAELSTQKAQLNKDVAAANAQKNKALAETGKAVADRNQAVAEKNKAFAERGQARSEAAKSRASAQESGRRAQSESRRAEAEARRAAGEGRKAEAARLDAKRAQQQLKGRQAELKQAERGLASKQAQLAKTQADVVRVTRQRDAVAKQRAAQGKEILAQGREILEQTSKVSELRAQVDGLKSEVEQSQVALALAQTTLDTAQAKLNEALTKPSLVAAGETLAEKTIAPRQSLSAVQAQLSSLMEEARAQARQLGGGNLKMGIDATRRLLIDNRTEVVDEKTQLSLLAQGLVSVETASSVRVIAARSHTASELTIQVLLIAIEVRPAFARGDVLASANIDGRSGDAAIFKQLYVDLANDGQRAAEKKGVQPPLARNVPFYAPNTIERIFEALRSIQALKGLANVRIVASEDLSTTSPLRVRFEVVPAASRSK